MRDFVVGFLLPFVSLLLGFWVAFRRPRDPLAWLLLALMLSFPHILQTFVVNGWPPGWREAGRVLREHPLGGFPHHHLSCSAASFPSPSPREVDTTRCGGRCSGFARFPSPSWVGFGVIVNVGGLSDYRSVAGLHRMLAPLTPVSQVLSFVLIGSFFAAMGIKLGLSQSPDAKRRLRFLYWGAIAAFTPSIVLSLYARLQGKSPNEIFPAWLIAVVLIPLILFPLTLSYVIVVQKAMGVGVALRQGLQYTLAKGGIRILQMIAIGACHRCRNNDGGQC